MALVTNLERIEKERSTVHAPTQCSASIVVGRDGKRYLQLDTYGSTNRQMPDKISQTIQLDEHAAEQLKALIGEAFPRLA